MQIIQFEVYVNKESQQNVKGLHTHAHTQGKGGRGEDRESDLKMPKIYKSHETLF